ncbi:2226_t:CDS:10 [Entrophospora sp. SA101]|nr:2226_t:CDS:10 [Entrophospora sp. SA101]
MPSSIVNNSPKRRHSYNNTPTRSSLNTINDDEAEKSLRRKSFAESMRRRSGNMAVIGSPPILSTERNSFNTPLNPPRPLEIITPIPKIPAEQMSINYEEWMKLVTDNKINAQNSWKLALIDYFHEMSLLKDGDSINFQKASCTLDGCVKIYTSRVDSVATETGKLLNGLADSSKNDLNLQDDEDEDEADPEKRTKKKRNRSESTLVTSYDQLILKKFDLEFTVDPLFKKTSADFDEGGAQGLLLNHLSVDSDVKIIFDASDAIPVHKMEDDNNIEDNSIQLMDLTKLRTTFLPDLESIFSKDICPVLKGFNFFGNSEVDFDFFLRKIGDDGDDDDDCIDSRFDFVENHYTAGGNGSELFMDNGGGDDGEDDIFLDQSFEVDDERSEHQQQLSERDYLMAMSNNENELFSYFDSAFLRNWAGPEHWKLKRAAKKKPEDENGETKGEKKKKDPFLIDFIESDDIDTSNIFVAGKNTIIDPKLAERLPHRNILPDDMHFSSKQLLKLFLKPQPTVSFSEKDFENENIEVDENFWAEHTNGDLPETNDLGGGTFFNDDYDGTDDELDYGENLVSQPKIIKPEFVKYSKKAKRVDVKKLKENIWKTLIHSRNSLNASENEPNVCDNIEENETLPVVKEQKLSDVVQNLQGFYKEKALRDISVQFCFICVLHLANEKNLDILPIGYFVEEKDFAVSPKQSVVYKFEYYSATTPFPENIGHCLDGNSSIRATNYVHEFLYKSSILHVKNWIKEEQLPDSNLFLKLLETVQPPPINL